ncbi:hypothetical protein L208DRAFT_1418118 [Tricholoma matsutake]|nr:hypothetical protein L208DRAFT_1418118 [Tricholoma matsutake 945]
MLMNTSNQQPLMNTPPSNRDLLELEMSQPLQEFSIEMSIDKEERHIERDQAVMKLGGNVGTKHQLTLLTRMMDPPLGREKESQTRRNAMVHS